MGVFGVAAVGVAPEAALIGKKLIKLLPSLEPVPVESLWQDTGSCVIVFFRRWGCLFCQQSAAEISTLAPLLQANRVKLVGIGFEEEPERWTEFMNKDLFAGELYVDPLRETYVGLGMKKHSFCLAFGYVFTPKALAKIFTSEGMSFLRHLNLVGDLGQNGGCMVVTNGGKDVPLIYREENTAVHVPPQDVLRALNISNDPITKEPK